MSELVKLAREPDHSCKLPENLDTPVWHYMDMYKFYSLLNERALYLCRADLLQDRFEGTFSRHQILEMEDFYTKIGESYVCKAEREKRRNDRLRTYISCWCMSDCDLDLMWKGYVRNPPGIAIKSTISKLKNICDTAVCYWPLDISIITYFDHAKGENINNFGTPTTFIYKDKHFKLDNELRLIHHPHLSEPTPTHVFLPIDLKDLIEEVVFQPKVKEDNVKQAIEVLAKVGLEGVPIFSSRDDRELIE